MSRAAFARPLRIIKTKGVAAVPWYERDLLFSAFSVNSRRRRVVDHLCRMLPSTPARSLPFIGVRSPTTARARCGTSGSSRIPRSSKPCRSPVTCASRATWVRGTSLSRLKRLPVPVSKLQSELLRLLASRRDPESFVAGGVAINRTGPRISRDIDIFHDREERVATTALEDAQILSDAGYAVSGCANSRRSTAPRSPPRPRKPNSSGSPIATSGSSRR